MIVYERVDRSTFCEFGTSLMYRVLLRRVYKALQNIELNIQGSVYTTPFFLKYAQKTHTKHKKYFYVLWKMPRTKAQPISSLQTCPLHANWLNGAKDAYSFRALQVSRLLLKCSPLLQHLQLSNLIWSHLASFIIFTNYQNYVIYRKKAFGICAVNNSAVV